MHREEILAMEVGEELDKLVAEAMGEPMPEFIPENALDFQLAGSPIKSPKGNWLCLCNYDEGDIPTWRPLPYSSDISAAWQVVEKVSNWDNRDAMLTLKGQGKNPTPLEDDHGEWWEATIDDDTGRKWQVETRAAPEAICKAALLVKLEDNGGWKLNLPSAANS